MNTPAADARPDILIVDDDEMVQAFLALHLENEGYGVRKALNGAQMIGALTDGAPDLIVLDLNLPDGDGLSLARQVREHSSVPIIVATARKGHDDRLAALGLGADDYLTKPFDPEELILRVRNLLDRTAPSSPPAPPAPSRPAHDQPAPSSPPVQAAPSFAPEKTPEPVPQPGPLPQPVIEDGAAKEPKPGTRKGLLILAPVLAVSVLVIGAVIAVLWPASSPGPSFVSSFVSDPGPSPVQAAPVSVPAAHPVQPKPSGVQATLAANPAMDVTIAAPEAGAASPSAPVSAPAAGEDLIRPIAEVLGYGWVLNSQCAKIPGVKWWKYKSHESIAGYVARKHGGDWTPYKKTWLRRLAKLQDILGRDSSAVTRTGIVLKGDALARYAGQMQKRLAVIHCLAGEAKAFAAGKKSNG